MAELLEYKCPCCAGAIEFDPTSQKMKCPYCDTEFETETLAAMKTDEETAQQDELNWTMASDSTWTETETAGMRVYICQSCGGEIVAEAVAGAMACPFCDNPIVVTEQFAGALRPDFILPFQLDKQAAKEGLTRHLANKRLLPDVFRAERTIDEIRGIYVPYWLFDSEADAEMRFRGTRVRHWMDRNYSYTETSHYSVVRGGQIAFAAVPVDASSKMPDDLMESLEPYDLSAAVDFSTAYMAGYLADKYDVPAESSAERANERIRASVTSAFTRAATGYASLVPEQSSIRLKDGTIRYGLYPVWLLHVTWKGERYTFAMNGQTGKFVGNLPVDQGKFWKYVGIGTAIGTAVCYALGWLMYWL